MPLPLSQIALQEKNKLGSDSVWLLALEIEIPGLDQPVRVVRNTEDITWRGQTWVAFPFELNEITEQAGGEVPRVDLMVSNVSRAIESYLQQWDAWTKQNGKEPITVNIYLVNSLNLASDDPEVEYVFQLRQPKTDNKWARFTLSGDNPYNRRFPLNRILKDSCPYRFKGARCGYTGAASTCGHTLTNCRSLGNSSRFGGCPGAGQSGLRISD
ncbi:MAG: DUF1833 family protein [Thermodesulfobacteriota bacterium]